MTYSPKFDFLIQCTVPDGPDVGSGRDGYSGQFFDPVSQMWGPWGAWSAQSVGFLRIAGHTFHTYVDGIRAEVFAQWRDDGPTFLKTAADETWVNNLLALQWSRFLSIAEPPASLFDTREWEQFLTRVRLRERIAASKVQPFGYLGGN
ncbi:MAG: hypothetical protein QM773_13800 [Hyphomonadaceae bacterium]